MPSRITHLAAAVSLAIALTLLSLWGRSYLRQDTVGYSHNALPGPTAVDWGYHLTSQRGVLTLAHYVDRYADPAAIASQHRESYRNKGFWNAGAATPAARSLAFARRHNVHPYGTNDNWQVTVPHAVPLALAIPLPLVVFARLRRHRRRVASGACLACGYDLRGTPGRCPECGTVAA